MSDEPKMAAVTQVNSDTYIEIDRDSEVVEEGEVAVAVVTGETAVVLVGDPQEVERVIVDADMALNRDKQAQAENQPVHDEWDIPPLTREQAEDLGIEES